MNKSQRLESEFARFNICAMLSRRRQSSMSRCCKICLLACNYPLRRTMVRANPYSGTFTRGRRRSPKSKGAMRRLCEGNGRYWISSRIVHFKFNRMRGVFEADHLSHLQLDIAVDEIVIEHPAGLQEVAIFLEIADRFPQ
jgi:hypothetical protein